MTTVITLGTSNTTKPLVSIDALGHGNWRHACHAPMWVGFYTIFANLPFWMASHLFGLLPLGWFCTEYVAVGLVALFVPRILVGCLLLLVILADLISAVSKTFYLAPTECLANLRSLGDLSGTRLFSLASVVILSLLVVTMAIYFPKAKISGAFRWSAAAGLITFATATVAMDYLALVRENRYLLNPFQGTRPSDANRFSDYRNLWMSRYPVLRLSRNEVMFGRGRDSAGASQPDTLPYPSATALAVSSAGLNAGTGLQQLPNLVVVLTESWGLDADQVVRNSLVQPYSRPELQNKYEVLQGTVPFYGSTVAGESRELCGSKFGSSILDSSASDMQSCLPARLARLGYRDMAVHGMAGNLFSRSTWYGKIGFREVWFKDHFQQQGLPDCVGAFVGTCDADIAAWIGHRLEAKDSAPDFVYWVTLNSHLPVPIPSALPNGVSCALTHLLSQQPALCSWYQLLYNVNLSVSRLAMAKLARPTIFVIVGDHAPPFANPLLQEQFSRTVVPYVVLLPSKTRAPT